MGHTEARIELPVETKDFLDWLYEQLISMNETSTATAVGNKCKEVCENANHNHSRS